ncbi:hypothetical protein F5148DRAFT_581926 [Russula earlei]|uniref:Uncharacterized protein n=1 Tax=Russula earlei TaxID=71964 RepID=A0ACC0UHX9_9AGAM|nr:hypothetical protein F5148DRAFT_581926 [Russula earlei]
MARLCAHSSSSELCHRNRPIKKAPKRVKSSVVRLKSRYKTRSKLRTTPSLRSPLNFVYVGNLRADVQSKDLERLFKTSGKVTKVEIRCCSGLAVPSITNTNTFYATILFASVEGATKALEMNGTPLLERKIVVSPSFLGLPEADHSKPRVPVKLCGFNVTELCHTLHRTADELIFGKTQIL